MFPPKKHPKAALLSQNMEAAGIEPAQDSPRRFICVRSLIAGLILGLILIAGMGKAREETRYQQARRIVYAVFPNSTQAAALRVVRCETGGTYSPGAYNPSSGATGYFQVLRGNSGRTFRYKQMRFTIKAWKLSQPWHNAAAAFWLSHGGRDWHEWSCRP